MENNLTEFQNGSYPLSEEDQRLLTDMCSPDAEITMVVRPTQPPDVIMRSLWVVARGLEIVKRKDAALTQIIGKILSIIKNNPHIYTTYGYKTFNGFLKGHVVETLGVSRTTLRDAVAIYEAFPATSPETVAEVGVTKMNLLRRHLDHTQPGYEHVLEAAKTQSYRKVLTSICERENIPPEEIDRAVIVIQCTQAQKAMWQEFADDPRVRSMCQTEDWGLILEMLIAEGSSEWLQAGDQP